MPANERKGIVMGGSTSGKVKGRHTTLDHETARSVDWIAGKGEITKITLGRHFARAHSKAPGTLRAKVYRNPVLTVVAYTGVGIRDIYVHTQHPDRIEQFLEERWPDMSKKNQTAMAHAFSKTATPPLHVPAHVQRAKLPDFQPIPIPEPISAPEPPKPEPFSMMDAAQVSGVEVKLVQVTPELASKWLASVVQAQQRKLKPGVVESYEALMKAGKWGVSDSVIAFDINNGLINGQHRLSAVVLAGVTIPSLVATGFPPEAIGYFDAGSGRKAVESYHILHGGTRPASLLALGTARFLMTHNKGHHTAPAREFIFETLEQYRYGIAFAEHELMNGLKGSKKGIVTAPVAAVITRAFYALPDQRDRLQAFAAALRSGLSTEGATDSPALLLRNFLQSHAVATSTGRRDIFDKTAWALSHFLKRTELKNLRAGGVGGETLFPLPGEGEEAAGERH